MLLRLGQIMGENYRLHLHWAQVVATVTSDIDYQATP